MTLLSAFLFGVAACVLLPVIALALGYVFAFLALGVMRLVIGDAPSRWP